MPIYHDYADDIPVVYQQPDVPVREQLGSIWIKGVNAEVATLVGNIIHNGHIVGVFGFAGGGGPSTFDPNDPVGISMCRCDASGAAIVLNLYPATGSGRQMIFKRENAGINTVTIAGVGADLIDGAASVVLALQYDSVTIIDTIVGGWSIISRVP
jgi:hypothetical protein